MEKKWLIILLFAIGLLSPTFIFAETVILKSGERIEKKIVEKTDEYIRVEFYGVPVTYFLDDIESIDGEELSPSFKKEEMSLQGVEFHFKKGTDYLNKGQCQSAIDEFKTTLSINPSHLGAHFNIGCAYALMGDYDIAIEEFENILFKETSPFNAFCYFNIAGVYVKRALLKKDPLLFEKASENFFNTIKILPNFILAMDYANHSKMFANPDFLNNVGRIGYSVDEIGIPPDSAPFLSKTKISGIGEKRILAFEADSPPLLYFYRSPNCHWRVCESKLDIQNPSNLSEEAKRCLGSLLQLLKNQPSITHLNRLIEWRAYSLFSYFYSGREDWDKAIEFAEKARDVGLNYSREYADLAYYYVKRGDYLKANEAAKKALEINPRNEERNLLEEIIRRTTGIE